MAATIRVGTCSFADESLSKLWYPSGIRTGEKRLRYYAEHFDTVEIDSTFYALPVEDTVAAWAARTPPDFVFHVKAFALMTRHPVRLERLPADLRDQVQADSRGRVERPSRAVRAEVFARFREALDPLRAAGKLGGILMQLPPYVVPKPTSFEYLEWAREQLGGDEMLVEFRHRSWLDEERRASVLGFLESLPATYVTVDAPRSSARNVLPTVPAVTSENAYVRMHGRNAATWNMRTRSAAERFDYLYSDEELAEWIEALRELAERSRSMFVMFNNNGRTEIDAGGKTSFIAQAPTNALTLRALLKRAGLPVGEPVSLGG
jgi:uncharacterized protein YecE (DUF72 family)